ncbi:MAG: ribose 5-phosphate isomerase [candidate division Zixibacteria bacterium SM23_81]|nr:MAG: ribose 5-phosphate isomerase [candidate division Zixibacteria bacterium SM23_81]
MKIAVGSDHAGYRLKEALKEPLESRGHQIIDYGTFSEESVDYPDIGFKVARGVANGQYERGILVCGSGQGMVMAANRVRGVRAALCFDPEAARMSRQHNDANLLVLSGWNVPPKEAVKILDVWLTTEFEGGRHLRRIKKLDNLML